MTKHEEAVDQPKGLGKVNDLVPVVGFSFSIKLSDRPDGDNVVIQYHLPVDMELGKMKDYTSKVLEVIEGEKLKNKYQLLLREKQVSETFIERSREDMQLKHGNLHALEEEAMRQHKSSGRKGELKFTGATGNQRDRMKQDIVSARQVLDTAETRHRHLLIELEMTEKKLGINSSADSC
jgi:hypothetical protein